MGFMEEEKTPLREEHEGGWSLSANPLSRYLVGDFTYSWSK